MPTPTKVRLDAMKHLKKKPSLKNSLDNIVKRLSSYNFKCPGNIERARQHRLLHSYYSFCIHIIIIIIIIIVIIIIKESAENLSVQNSQNAESRRNAFTKQKLISIKATKIEITAFQDEQVCYLSLGILTLVFA